MLLGTGELYCDSFYLEWKDVKLKKTRKKRHYFRPPKGFDKHLVCEAYPNCDEWLNGCRHPEDWSY